MVDTIQIYIIVVSIVFLIISFIANLYFLAHYAHPNDTAFGQSKIMRLFAVKYHSISHFFILDHWINYELSSNFDSTSRCGQLKLSFGNQHWQPLVFRDDHSELFGICSVSIGHCVL